MAKKTAIYDPQANAIRADVVRYLCRTGLTRDDFARRIGYASSTVYNFLQGRYEGNPRNISAASKDFMALHPIAPVSVCDGRLYETANVRAWRNVFKDCIGRGRAAVVYGPPGIQKSFPIEHLIAELNREEMANNTGRRAYYVYCPANVRPNQLLKLIAEACGSLVTGDNVRIVRNLRFDFRGLKVLLVLDEAQHLNIDCLETVRQLLDRLGFGLIFSGSHDVYRMFERPLELEQLRRRIWHAIALPGMTLDDARAIIAHELGDVKEKTIENLIAAATITDPRTQTEYISAGRLFPSIHEVREDPRFRAVIAAQKSVQ